MNRWNQIQSGLKQAPVLELQQSWWAMTGLGENGREWSERRKFEKIAEAGFKGISARIPDEANREEWLQLLEAYDLSFSAIAFPSKPEDLERVIRESVEFGKVQYINAQVMDSFVVDDRAVQLLNELLHTAEKAGIPLFIETHRGTVTQDLLRTVNYVRAIPGLSLMIDLSHYVVAGELNGESAAAEACFDELLARTAGIHARVSNGEQVQIDIGEQGEHPMLRHFARWWRKGMANWLEDAQEGDILPFVTELGPPGNYAITRRNEGGQEVEISDRWQQALLLKRIAEEQWKKAKNEFSAS